MCPECLRGRPRGLTARPKANARQLATVNATTTARAYVLIPTLHLRRSR
jgi:hypothetical protein